MKDKDEGSELVDMLLQSIADTMVEISDLGEKLDALKEKANLLAGNEDVEAGTVVLKGVKLKGKITRRVNVSYSDKDKLNEIFKKSKKLMDMFSFTAKESGQKVEKYLVAADKDDNLAKELMAIRVKKAGSPSIEVLPNG